MPTTRSLRASALSLALLVACSSDTNPAGVTDVNDDISAEDSGGTTDVPTFGEDTAEDIDRIPDIDATPIDTGSTTNIGEPCRTDDDCDSDLCAFFDASSDEGFCTDNCADASNCPDGWTCLTFSATGQDAVQRCVAPDLCLDADEDGYGTGPGCAGRDCDDERPDVSPVADEICNGIDDDCDGRIDDNPIDERRSCETGFVGRCGAGQSYCENGLLNCAPTAPATAEVCDGIDNNCDGESDEGGVCEGEPCCYNDLCEGVCETARRNASGSCAVPANYSTTETCDELDNNCDGQVDEGVLLTFYADIDEDGFGDPDAPVMACALTPTTADNDGDCNDEQVSINPDATEICDDIDNDCDDDVDSGVCAGNPCCWQGTCEGVCATAVTGDDGLCTAPAGYGAEICDDIDNDCDGDVDSGVCGGIPCCWQDNCAGICGTAVTGGDGLCAAPAGFGAEVCDGIDNDCDGSIDEENPQGGTACSTGLQGACGTGVSRCEEGALVCDQTVFSSAEICDGIDNNCDGRLDDGNPGGGGVCDTGALGVCGRGLSICNGGSLTCLQTANPAAETCDGVDNDCDGVIDESNPGGGAACVTGLLGVCGAGTTTCRDGSVTCVGNTTASAEVCDGFDNNCNGQVDEANPGGGGTCDTGALGVCGQGRLQCVGAGLVCQATGFASAEVCDGVDNDCDGLIDEGNPGAGGSCNTGAQGACSTGTLVCSDGGLTCNPTTTATTEICDGIDNDCDGVIDNGNPGGGGACTSSSPGVCAPGTLTCSGGAVICRSNVAATAEICDGLDNDCDGTVDDGNPGGGAACSTGAGGLCDPGTTACSGGALVCNRNVNGTAETCDGIDNNCDGLIDNGANCTNCVQRNNGNKSYLFCSQHPGYWTDAVNSCAARGYRLVTINDATENAWLRTTAASAFTNMCNNTCNYARDFECDDGGLGYDWRECAYGTDCADCGTRSGPPPNFWIGLSDSASEGNFVWTSGQPRTYTNWGSGEPNDSGGEDCGELSVSSGLWNDTECSEYNRPFVCESN